MDEEVKHDVKHDGLLYVDYINSQFDRLQIVFLSFLLSKVMNSLTSTPFMEKEI